MTPMETLFISGAFHKMAFCGGEDMVRAKDYTWQKSRYTLLKGRWGIAIWIEAGYLMTSEIEDKNNYTEISDLPQNYINAVLSVEDHRFYKHCGIDLIAIGRATINDIKAMDFVEGGSTITQQLAKNIYFTQDKKFERKIAEVFMAFKIENKCEKDEILELYLNTSYFGDGYYSVREASLGYFGKEPNQMTDYEAIMLAGIPNAPSVYAPTKNPESAKQRQKQVINKMIEYKYLTQNEADKVLKQE